VSSQNVRIDDKVVKGYTRESLWDSWQRYLEPPTDESATSAKSATPTDVADVADLPEANLETLADALDLLDFDAETEEIAP
jgi:hypothetical protein